MKKTIKVIAIRDPTMDVKRSRYPFVAVVCRKNVLVYKFILTLVCHGMVWYGVTGAPHSSVNRTCPILLGSRNEDTNNGSGNDSFYVSSNETNTSGDEEGYDIIALNLYKEPHQEGKEDYSFLYDYLTGVGLHDFNDTITIGFLGAYGQTQVR